MTDDLVQRLRSNRPIPTIPHEAADRIEAQAAEIERLRERVKKVENNNRELRGSKERVYAATDLRQPTQSDADVLEEMRFTYEVVCSEGYNDPDYTEALDFEIEARGWEAAFAVAVAKLRQPKQSDALRDQLLQECLVKLRDVQGTEAPKQYACNLIKRIERVLEEQSK